MRGCEVLFGAEKAVEVRELMAGCGVPCPCDGDDLCPGCPIMGDRGQRSRLAVAVVDESSRGSWALAAHLSGYKGVALKRGPGECPLAS